MEPTTSKTPNKSEYLDFALLYGWAVWYCKDNAPEVGGNKCYIDGLAGVSLCIGKLISYWILTMTGHVISQTTVQRFTELEPAMKDIKTNSTNSLKGLALYLKKQEEAM
jgi:hypothetical protein